MSRVREMLGVLEALDVLTPERLERIKRNAAKTGAARVLRALQAYDQAVTAYKQGRARPLALAHAHAELMAAMEQSAGEIRSIASQLIAVLRSVRGPMR